MTRDTLTSPLRTAREIAGNNRLVSYALVLGAGFLVVTGRVPSIPSWWPVIGAAAAGVGVAGWYWSDRILDMLPDEQGILLVEFAADDDDNAIHELSTDRFERMEVIGSLYQWDQSPRRVYEVREYDPAENVAVGNWRESEPGSEIASKETVADALAAVSELREDIEPRAAEARELRRRIRGIVRAIEKDRAEAQQDLLDEHLAPGLGDGKTVSEIVDEELPDELHPLDGEPEPATNGHETTAETDESDENSESDDSDEMDPDSPGVSDEMIAALQNGA
jgi:hypothetical protein